MPVNGIEMCVETFGEPTEPPMLLLAGDASSMDWWDDEFCRRLAAGNRFVIRYDHRDTGRSTSYPAGAPDYSAADLMHDAVGVLDALRLPAAHLVGFSFGSALAQRIAVHYPSRVLSLALIAAAVDGPLAAPTPESPLVALGGPLPVSTSKIKVGVGTVEARLATEETDWSNRRSAVSRMIDEVRARGGPFTPGESQLRRLAERIFDRSADLAATRLNHQLAGYGPPIRDLLRTIETPTVVLHGTLDQRFPADHPEELARSIPGARLVWLDGVGHEFPPRAVWGQVLNEILAA
ncbi:Pimeloyl-ACP methyl ester carboxylesterase [Actinoplanes derwentensis]|uniref:Pimeloyl-ACP methyl ester carboxylesterase n=2 Tax=Actinoplanes derwentensis TaxID=113562 RepID=A0A1H2A2G1_9ACTN|nr:hypothetical protein Ade03nite_23340 [Actinoplanes derwentensis]SDT40175.1 Pimeloyl-ACP methyl ester carboxylesterase [Actinoplanes derwentensis]